MANVTLGQLWPAQAAALGSNRTMLVSGSDGTNLRAIATSTDGELLAQRAYATATVTLSTSTSLSGALDLEGFSLAAIQMSTGWTDADLSFQAAASSSGTFMDIYDYNGVELTVETTASRVVSLGGAIGEVLAPIRHMKVRSGTSTSGVNQSTDRTLTLILKG